MPRATRLSSDLAPDQASRLEANVFLHSGRLFTGPPQTRGISSRQMCAHTRGLELHLVC